VGHRANFVLVRGGIATAYADDWAGLGTVYLVTEGPDTAVSAVENMDTTNELFDWAFCEGGFLIDHDERLLIVFGGLVDPSRFAFGGGEDQLNDEDGGPEPTVGLESPEADARAFLAQIQPSWPDWTIRWDERGADAFSEHLTARGVSTVMTQTPSHPERCLMIELRPGAA
jgi:hypothetical protein